MLDCHLVQHNPSIKLGLAGKKWKQEIAQQFEIKLKPTYEDAIIYEPLMTILDLLTMILLSVNFWLGFTILVHGRLFLALVAQTSTFCHRRQVDLNPESDYDQEPPPKTPSIKERSLRRTSSCPSGLGSCSQSDSHGSESPWKEVSFSSRPSYTATLCFTDD